MVKKPARNHGFRKKARVSDFSQKFSAQTGRNVWDENSGADPPSGQRRAVAVTPRR